MAEKTLDKIELEFTADRDTKRTRLFLEQLGEQTYSDQDVAIGTLYVKLQALEMIGNPSKLKVTIEPVE